MTRDSAIQRPSEHGGRYGDYDRSERHDRRVRYDRYDRPDGGGRDRSYDREDRHPAGRDHASRDPAGRDQVNRDPAGRERVGGDGGRDRSGYDREDHRRPASRDRAGVAGRDWSYDREDRHPAGRDRAYGNRRGDDRPRADRDSGYRADDGRDYHSGDRVHGDRDYHGGDRKGRDGAGGERKRRSGTIRGLAVLLAVAAMGSLAVTGYACTLALLSRAHLGRGVHSGSAAGSYVVTGIASFVSSSAIVSALAIPKAAAPTTPAAPPPVSLVLTARDKRDCPPAATACVDLAEHITWLQSNGKVTYGPVQMEPGPPGSVHATPTGTFNVQWKAGPNYMSNIYHEPIPWAVFFAPGGIAFHEGSLTVGSHGCVHLTMDAAHYYNQHLSIGAEVVVF
jgi:hypothetical protein